MFTLLLHLLGWVGLAAASLVILLVLAWGAGALYFDLPVKKLFRVVAVLLWVAGWFLAFYLLPDRPIAFLIGCAVYLGLVIWWSTLKPSLHRDWKPEVAVIPYAEVEGDVVTVHNVRNFVYRSRDDFTPRYETRRFSLPNLRGIDVFFNYWTSRLMAHPIVSFDFGEEGRIAFSIEIRTERGEKYSPWAGLYRQFELILIAADEQDIVKVRTNFRDEEVYLYRMTTPRDQARRRFLEYVDHMNQLYAKADWYNAITENCTTSIHKHYDPRRRGAWDWRIIVNGFADKMLYDRGGLDTRLPFEELRRRSQVNERAKAIGNGMDFSIWIRE